MYYLCNGRFRHDGKLYLVGDEVELSKAKAAPFVDSGLLTEKQKPPSPTKAKTTAKTSETPE